MEKLKDTDILRKYISLSELIFLIKNNKLYFGRADINKKYKKAWFIREETKYTFFFGDKEVIKEDFPDIDLSLLIDAKDIAKYIYINSWNTGTSESNALWKIFSLKDECVVLQTNVQMFKNSIDPNLNLIFEKVDYSDFGSNHFAVHFTAEYLEPFRLQDISYQFRSETRIILSTFENTYPDQEMQTVTNEYDEVIGFYIPVDISKLINKIIIYPDAEPFVIQSIKSMIEKYLPEIKVNQSTLEYKE